MSAKNKLNNFNHDELADAFILTQSISGIQKKKAGDVLKVARGEVKAKMSEETRLTLDLMQFKFRLEDYLQEKNFNPKYTFSYFFREYVSVLQKKRKQFASEIDITESELSQLLNKHRIPNDIIFVRLEIHSNNFIPATYWYKLVEKEKENKLKSNSTLRSKERKNVKNKLNIL